MVHVKQTYILNNNSNKPRQYEMQEYSALQSKMKFKETGFIFHISWESFKLVRLFRETTYI